MEYNTSYASDVSRLRALTGNQRMPVSSHMTDCVKYANMGEKHVKRNTKIQLKSLHGMLEDLMNLENLKMSYMRWLI